MKIVHVHARPIAGMPYRIAESVKALLPGWTITRVQGKKRHIGKQMGFPCGEPIESADEVRSHMGDSDLLHVHATDALALIPDEIATSRPVILTIHGQRAQLTIPPWVDRMTYVTPEMDQWYPSAVWIPNYLWNVESVASSIAPDAPFTLYRPVGHVAKNHADLDMLCALMPNMRVDASEFGAGAHENENVLERMNTAHVVWDHLQGYYGVTSLEALAMGAIPIASVFYRVAEKLKAFWSCDDLPWLIRRWEHTPTAEAYAYLRQLQQDVAYRQAEIERVTSWYRRVWDWHTPAQMYVDLYRELLG